MEIQKVVLVLIVFITSSSCDSAMSFNTKYNLLISKNDYNLKNMISAQLPKETKFFDLNDFDCKYYNYLRQKFTLNNKLKD